MNTGALQNQFQESSLCVMGTYVSTWPKPTGKQCFRGRTLGPKSVHSFLGGPPPSAPYIMEGGGKLLLGTRHCFWGPHTGSFFQANRIREGYSLNMHNMLPDFLADNTSPPLLRKLARRPAHSACSGLQSIKLN
jgi:hypothetical protein